MNKFFKRRTPLINLLAIIVLLIITTSKAVCQFFELKAVTDLERVFEDGYKLPRLYDTVHVFGIRNEIISGQCVISAGTDLTGVTVDVSSLTDPVSGKVLTDNLIEWNFAGSVPLKENAKNQRTKDLVRLAPGLFPDYLMQDKIIELKSNSYKSIWLTFTIPGNAIPGKYNGKVTVTSNRGERKLPVLLTVYPLKLPDERRLNVTLWYDTRNFSRFHGIDDPYSDAWYEMLRKYAKNMTEHRQNGFSVPVNTIKILRKINGGYEFDFTRFDKIANVFWDTGKMNFLETGHGLTRFGEGGTVLSTEVLFNNLQVTDSETGAEIMITGKDILPFLLPAFEKHLEQRGWLDRTFIHVKDEPNLANSEAWREMSDFFNKYAPGIKRIDALATTHVIDKIEIAVPKLDKISPQFDIYKKFQNKTGLEVWFYTVGIYQTNGYPNKSIDVPLMDNRILHWINNQYDLNGFLHWGWNHWTENPYEDIGMHIGDAWHVYPAEDGVINSLRWEQMRNGIQDYEYFRMMENRIRELMDSLGIDHFRFDPSQRGKEISSSVVRSFGKYNHDPENFYDTKRKIIAELIELQNSPKLFVQTTPAENSCVVDREVVEVIGFAEPDSEVWVNNRKAKVSSKGIFLMRTEAGKKDLEVRARSSRREIIVTRHFNIIE